MNKKHIYTALISCAIALNAFPSQAEESTQESKNTIFVCATQEEIPTMYSYTPGEVNLTPLMSWYPEYLLPNQSGSQTCEKTATLLQQSSQDQQASYIKTAKLKQKNIACLVADQEQKCKPEESSILFSTNPTYDASCVLSNQKPIQCKAITSRGNIYSFEDKPYQPTWWFW